MKKLFNFIFLLPLGIFLILISVANRQFVRFSLDPLSVDTPALSIELPLFVLLFVALILGLLLGGMLVWISQGKHRKALREKSYEANQLKQEKDRAVESTAADPNGEIAPGLPMVSRAG